MAFAPVRLGRSRAPATALRARGGEDMLVASDLEVGREIEGKVTQILTYGAFLDIGADKPGFLHVSKIRSEMVDDINNVLSLGDMVKARVKKVSPHGVEVSVRDDLPMWQKRPLSHFVPGDVVEGKVVHTTGLAVFVDIGAWVDGYLPIDQVKDGSEQPETMKGTFREGSELEAKVLETTPNRITLTMRTDMGV